MTTLCGDCFDELCYQKVSTFLPDSTCFACGKRPCQGYKVTGSDTATLITHTVIKLGGGGTFRVEAYRFEVMGTDPPAYKMGQRQFYINEESVTGEEFKRRLRG